MVLILPVNGRTDYAAVHVDGREVGLIVRVEPDLPWVGFDGSSQVGPRWLPDGVDDTVEGPATCSDAALLLLVLAGYDPETAIRALGMTRTPTRRAG